MPVKLISKSESGLTPKKKMTDMVKAYDNKFHAWSTEQLRLQYNDRPGIAEAKSVWVSKNEIDALLNENDGNGLRIYFACHTESTSTGDTEKYLGLHTVILVATKDNITPSDPSVDNSSDLVYESDDPATANSITFSGMGQDTLPTCPPRCSK